MDAAVDADDGGGGGSDAPPSTPGLRARTSALETALAAAEARAADADAAVKVTAAARADAAAARAQLADAVARADAADVAADAAAAAAERAAARLARGDADSASTRVLHLVRNPEAAAAREATAARIAELEGALAAARARADAGGGDSAGDGATDAAAAAAATARVADAEKRLARLAAAAGDAAAAYRGAVAALLGWRLDMRPPSTPGGVARFALRPTVGARPSDALVFVETAPGAARAAGGGDGGAKAFDLVPTDLSRAHAREVEAYVGRFGSVPALAAALMLDLFQRGGGGGE